jgi:hypothetical protein
MTIKDFKAFRAGSGWPAVLDIKETGTHESCGVMAVAYTHRTEQKDTHVVQFRVNRKTNEVALIALLFDDMPLPAGWEDSELIYSSESNA